tara:strand:- start:1118 stop:2530 length:1413 start_codon:yes stop_codon:yes gene_type:complete
MKTNKFLALGFGLVAMLFINSCVEDDDFATPDLTINPVDVEALGQFTSFSGVVARYNDAVADGEQVGVFSVENEAPLYTVGYVISDDGEGNFFEEIVLQNSVDGTDPANDVRRGLKVNINTRDLGGIYNFGRKVYIKLNGLAIGEENGVYTLGKSSGNSLEQLEEAEFANFVIRDPETASITPKMVAIEDLTELDESTYIQLNNSQIAKAQKDLTYAGEASDQFDGFRTIESCDSNANILLQTSTFADFKGAQLPQGKGSVKGVYSRDFGDDFSVLILNTVADISFTDPNRCDPVVLDCTGASGGGGTIFSENFTGFAGYAAEGWTMTNVDGGNVDWFISSFSGNNYSRISAFSSNETEAEVWLVTPDIDLDATTGEEFSFDVEAAFSNGIILSVLVSNDFTGDVTTATWTELDADIQQGPSSGFGGFESKGPINISCLDGTVNFAFKYEGSDPSATTRYHVDNVVVTGN